MPKMILDRDDYRLFKTLLLDAAAELKRACRLAAKQILAVTPDGLIRTYLHVASVRAENAAMLFTLRYRPRDDEFELADVPRHGEFAAAEAQPVLIEAGYRLSLWSPIPLAPNPG